MVFVTWRKSTALYLIPLIVATLMLIGRSCCAAIADMSTPPSLRTSMSSLFRHLIHRRPHRYRSLHIPTDVSAFVYSTRVPSPPPNEMQLIHRSQNEPRRRRGIIRSSQLERRSNDYNGIEDEVQSTQYTINDSVCPPTNTTQLKNLVQKHIETLPKYVKSRPTAEHNLQAFEEALEFVIDFSRLQQTTEERVKVILDSGCGTGRSTYILGEKFPDCVVIGIE